jgi:kynurenine 3-monooxygenase
VTLPWTISEPFLRRVDGLFVTPTDMFISSVEMRHSVTTFAYFAKKVIDNLLFTITSRSSTSLVSFRPLLSRMPYPPGEPSGWLPLYTMVTFRPDISYATAQKRAIRQAAIIERVFRTVLMLLGLVGIWLIWLITVIFI